MSKFIFGTISPLKNAYFRFTILKTLRKMNTLTTSSVKPPFSKAMQADFHDKIAIMDEYGAHTYGDILKHSKQLSKYISFHIYHRNKTGDNLDSMLSETVAFLCSSNVTYTIIQWAIWMSGGIAVPLSKSHPEVELRYIVNDSQSSLLVANAEFSRISNRISELEGTGSIIINDENFFSKESEDHSDFDDFVYWNKHKKSEMQQLCDDVHSQRIPKKWEKRNAMLIYTSGTTGRPKGVVLSFSNLHTQLEIITKAWEMTCFDTTLHTLPLHHVHGVVNALACPLWSGGTCILMKNFNPKLVWKQLIENPDVNVFHAVPTIYAMLIDYYEQNFNKSEPKKKEILALLSKKMRLMVSGSAALPETILQKWKSISGHTLLERYGMTEIGMALTNPLHGKRVPGAVGKPFPSVLIQIVSPDGQVLVEGDSNIISLKNFEQTAGDLLVKGPSVFSGYFNRPQATKQDFTEEGWFITGDTALYDEKNDAIRIMGRTSVDIIKTGGYKISALDVERHLLSHDLINEVAVIGLPDAVWGQVVVAVVALKGEVDELKLESLQTWAKERIPSYSIPRKLITLNSIPRNPMGKVNKKQLLKDLF